MLLASFFLGFIDETSHLLEITRRDLVFGEKVADKLTCVAFEQPIYDISYHRSAHFILLHLGLIDVGPPLSSVCDQTSFLQPRKQRCNRSESQAPRFL